MKPWHVAAFAGAASATAVSVLAGVVLVSDADHVGSLAEWTAAVGATGALLFTARLLQIEQRRSRSELRVEAENDGEGNAIIVARNFGGVAEVIFKLGFIAEGMDRAATPYGITNTGLPELPQGIIPRSALEWHLGAGILRPMRFRDIAILTMRPPVAENEPMPMRVFIELGTGERIFAPNTVNLPPIIAEA